MLSTPRTKLDYFPTVASTYRFRDVNGRQLDCDEIDHEPKKALDMGLPLGSVVLIFWEVQAFKLVSQPVSN